MLGCGYSPLVHVLADRLQASVGCLELSPTLLESLEALEMRFRSRFSQRNSGFSTDFGPFRSNLTHSDPRIGWKGSVFAGHGAAAAAAGLFRGGRPYSPKAEARRPGRGGEF